MDITNTLHFILQHEKHTQNRYHLSKFLHHSIRANPKQNVLFLISFTVHKKLSNIYSWWQTMFTPFPQFSLMYLVHHYENYSRTSSFGKSFKVLNLLECTLKCSWVRLSTEFYWTVLKQSYLFLVISCLYRTYTVPSRETLTISFVLTCMSSQAIVLIIYIDKKHMHIYMHSDIQVKK